MPKKKEWDPTRSGSKLQRSDRKRPPLELTLAPETIEKLGLLAARGQTSKSAVVDQLVANAAMPKR